MKKVFFSLFACLLMTQAMAQSEDSGKWYVRAGVNLMNWSGENAEGTKMNIGYNVVGGYQKSISDLLYYGADFGFGTRGCKAEGDYKMLIHNLQLSPSIGIKYGVSENLSVDVHGGLFASYDFAGGDKENGESSSISDWEGWKEFDAGVNVGVGVWFSRYNVDITYQRGFLEPGKDAKMFTNNIMIRLGMAF
ncbi:MAG: porin family protein [Prevotellaceae bacterium]|jgi:hypothetical protein|nr:porin family protein [Prevotellaceae bacterium]